MLALPVIIVRYLIHDLNWGRFENERYHKTLVDIHFVPQGQDLDMPVSLADGISDTCSQGHANLQSLIKCLDRRDSTSDAVRSPARLY